MNSPFGGVTSAVLSMSDAERLAGQWRVVVAFDVQPTTEALCPPSTQRKPKTGGPETALVVGPDADTAESNIYTDSLGRIKVQFPWDRYGQKNQNSSCWVRVSSSWAGNQLGAMHVPRIGQEVIVDFLGGDPDLPIATGRVYNQLNTPPWSLPEQQALSGFRSRELNPGAGNSAGGRSNHLILDDTKEKIQAQLKSDHQHSQLSLGHITRIEDNKGRKDYRSEGFELRTDGHGAIRAKDGLLISTEARSNAHGHVKSMTETEERLQDALEQHEDLGDLALQHEAQTKDDQPSVSKTLASQNQAISGKAANDASFPELNAPHIVLASPAGIATTTPGSTHQHSGQHHAITSAGHTSISAGKSFLVSAKKAIKAFSFKGGIKLVSAKDNVEIQALRKSVNMIAKLDITHTAERISINGKKFVQIEGGGSYVRWDGSITGGTTGSYLAHAGSHGLPAGKSKQTHIPPLPFVPENLPKTYSIQMNVLGKIGVADKKGRAAALPKFRAYNEQGELLAQGFVDARGNTPPVYTEKPEAVRFVFGDGFWGKSADVKHT